jgi:hypothetical protein
MMEVDESEWKPRYKLLLVEAVSTATTTEADKPPLADGAAGHSKPRDVNWAAVSRLLRKHIPEKRLASPASYGSRVRTPSSPLHFYLFIY